MATTTDYQKNRTARAAYARTYYQQHKTEERFVLARQKTTNRINHALAVLKALAEQGDQVAQQQLAAHREYDRLRKRVQRAAKQG